MAHVTYALTPFTREGRTAEAMVVITQHLIQSSEFFSVSDWPIM